MDRRKALKNIKLLSIAGLISTHIKADITKLNVKQADIKTDILVVGGGTAGVVAAIQSARGGCKTTLIESGSQLGGTITTGGVCFPGLFHAWGKQIIAGIGWELVSETVEMSSDKLPDFTIPTGRAHYKHQILINAPLYSMLSEEKCLQAGVDIHYYEIPTSIRKERNSWIVEIIGKDVFYKIETKQIIDCTGNASVCHLAGYKRFKESNAQPGSLIFELDGYDYNSLDQNELKKRYDKAIENGTLLKPDAYHGVMELLNIKKGLATQHVLHADSSTSSLHTKANISGRASLLRIIRFVRSLPGCENAYIKSMQPETAIRETYRIDGLYRITNDDYLSGRIFKDSMSYAFYPIDLHVENGVTPVQLTEGIIPSIPLRALIPKESENILVAGRCLSSEQLANSGLRVQASCMGMGQMAAAAAICACKNNTTPEKVPINDVKRIIVKYGGIVPDSRGLF